MQKHIKVTIDRTAIDDRFDEKYTEQVRSESPQVNGFRPGKAPARSSNAVTRRQAESRFARSVDGQPELAGDREQDHPAFPPDLILETRDS